jgi:hypothetical protein
MKRVYFAIFILISVSPGLFAGGAQEVQAQEPSGGQKSVESSGVFLAWEVSDGEIIFTLRGETTGWVSVGFNPTRVMKDAQMILGYVKDGAGYVEDQFGTGTFTHKKDTDLGGSRDIRLISSSESSGRTELVFAVPIDSGDEYDSILTPGVEHTVLLAHGANGEDNFTKKHASRGKVRVTF